MKGTKFDQLGTCHFKKWRLGLWSDFLKQKGKMKEILRNRTQLDTLICSWTFKDGNQTLKNEGMSIWLFLQSQWCPLFVNKTINFSWQYRIKTESETLKVLALKQLKKWVKCGVKIDRNDERIQQLWWVPWFQGAWYAGGRAGAPRTYYGSVAG